LKGWGSEAQTDSFKRGMGAEEGEQWSRKSVWGPADLTGARENGPEQAGV